MDAYMSHLDMDNIQVLVKLFTKNIIFQEIPAQIVRSLRKMERVVMNVNDWTQPSCLLNGKV